MKRILPVLFLFSVLLTSAQSFVYKRIQNAGATELVTQPFAQVIYVYSSGSVTLSNNWSINYTVIPTAGTKWRVIFAVSSTNVNGHTISIFGNTLNANQVTKGGFYDFTVVNDHTGSPQLVSMYSPLSLLGSGTLNGSALIDHSVTLTKLDTMGYGRFPQGDASNNLTSTYGGTSGNLLIGNGNYVSSVPVTGDVTITSGGVTSITAGAAIARTKIASGTNDHVLINNGSGVMSSEATLDPTRGGIGADVSASTGFLTFSSGTATVAQFVTTVVVPVSFESTDYDNIKVYFPYACTVTGGYAQDVTDIAGTDDGTIIFKNNAGTTMGGGGITCTAAEPKGTARTFTCTTNNTFSAFEFLTVNLTKTTPGGRLLLHFLVVRNQ